MQLGIKKQIVNVYIIDDIQLSMQVKTNTLYYVILSKSCIYL